MARLIEMLLVAALVAACQSTGTATIAPTTAAATASTPASNGAPTTGPTTAPTKPVTVPRVADVPLDGTCEDENVSCLGALEPGTTYATKVWEPTMSFKVQSSDWVNVADLGGDFGLLSKRDIGDAIMFFRDARSVDTSVGATVTDIAAWLATNDELTVTPFVPAQIGGLTGVMLDIRTRPGATSTDPTCPVQVCVQLLRGDDPVPNDPYQWHWDWSNAGTEVQRLYLLHGKDTVIAIFVDSLDGLTFDGLTTTFDEMKPTITFG
ncbi:MAG: hypothetical protein ABI555_06090 [Chloroflexota bacterium]